MLSRYPKGRGISVMQSVTIQTEIPRFRPDDVYDPQVQEGPQ
jgi:hypothetical protein